MADLHDEAARGINTLEPLTLDGPGAGTPWSSSGVDGGFGWELVKNIQAVIQQTAGEVAVLNETIAGRVRTSVDLVAGYDQDAARDFSVINEGMP